jgi:hypothetical protein
MSAPPGFKDMLDRIAGNGVRTIIVESPDRFARDLAVQLAGHDFLKNLGVALIPATAPETPSAPFTTARRRRRTPGSPSKLLTKLGHRGILPRGSRRRGRRSPRRGSAFW